MVGLVGAIVIAMIAVNANVVYPHNPFEMNLYGATYEVPSFSHIMGTDGYGRDVFGRVVFGLRTSLFVAIVSALMSATAGLAVGAIAGYRGGAIDDISMRLVDAILTIPAFILALLIVATFGANIYLVTFVIAFTMWPTTARLIRAEFLSLKEQSFVESAVAIGCGEAHIIFREILPNAIFPAVINLSLQMAAAILTESGLSFLGLGDPNQISLGTLLNEAMPGFRRAWWLAVFPGLAISLMVISFNLIGDGVNDAFNPHLKER